MRLPLIIDGVDFTSVVSKYGYKPYVITRQGKNGGTMLNGDVVVDILAYKTGVSIRLNPMTGADAAAIMAAVSNPYVEATVWDVRTNSEKTATFITKISQPNLAILRSSEKWWSGITITLEEK